MKKVIYVFFVCLILLSITFYFYINKDDAKGIVKKLNNFYEELFGEKLEVYDENFVINSLVKKSDTYYYNTLTEQQKNIYTSIANAIKNFKNDFEIKEYEYVDEKTANDDIEVALYRFLLDHPEVFYINNKYTISTSSNVFGTKINLIFDYLVESQDELNNKIEQIKESISEVEKNIKDGDTELDIELKTHDYIGKNVTYYSYDQIENIPINCHNIYGTLIEKQAVCDGISKTLKLVLNNYNMDCIVVTGKLKKESHAWNMVKLDDNWYNLDTTSDKSVKTSDKNYVIHSYFNINNDLILNTHSFDNKEILPFADSMDKNYYILNNKVISKTEIFNDKFTEILNNNDNQELLEFSTDEIGVPEKIAKSLSYKNYDSGYVDKNSSKFSYYNVLNTYILLKLY